MKKLFIVCTLLVTSFLYANDSGKPQKGGTLVFARAGDSVTLDPGHAIDGESSNAAGQIYDGLVQFKIGTTEIIPALATSWDISRDGLTYTFYLRKGVKFHKTKYFKKDSKFTSRDVIFSFKRQMDLNHIKGDQAFRYWLSMNMSKIIKDIKALGKYKVVITLNQPEAPFLANLVMRFASILSKDYYDELKVKNKLKDLGRKPIGTGPFIFQDWKRDDKIKFVRNENYWNGSPYIKKLIFKVITNSSARVAALKKGEVHIIDSPNPAEVKNLEKNKKIKLIKIQGFNVGYLAMNTQKKPFDNVKVRQAIRYATNVKGIIKAVYEGLAVPAVNPIPPGMLSFDKTLAEKNKYAYNVKKAKKLLKEAGYEKGFKATLWAMPVSRPYMPNAQKVAEIIQSDLAKINIKIAIKSTEWGKYIDNTSNGEHDMALLGWTGDNGDPDNFLDLLLSNRSIKRPAQNIAFWNNKNFSDVTMAAKRQKNENSAHTSSIREGYYLTAQRIFENEAPWVPIAHAIVVEPILKKVHGFVLEPIANRRFLRVWIEKKGKK